MARSAVRALQRRRGDGGDEGTGEHWAVQLAFYLVAGLGWGVPILPLLSWMNRGR